MGQSIVHFEIIGRDPQKLRRYFGELFGSEFDTSAPVAEAVSQPCRCPDAHHESFRAPLARAAQTAASVFRDSRTNF
jgi:hypothetical protein